MIAAEPEPKPGPRETPAEFADRLGSRFSLHTATERRRESAQFFTPLEVARFMASLARPSRSVRRLLDPGAGTGILACALCEALLPGSGPVHLDAYEIDAALVTICKETLAYARRWLARSGITLTFTVHQADYVMENAAFLRPGLFDNRAASGYDIAISNPPYFKLQKSDRRALAASSIVHGQPNIYALFMSITASLLAENGVMVTITPRSFTAGDYFRIFRRHLFATVVPEAVHLFHSRKDAFRNDAVLQENVIVRARRGPGSPAATVTLSSSAGVADLQRRDVRHVPLASVVDVKSRNAVFSIPADKADDAVIGFVGSWPGTLHGLGLEVSTGPVVAFRARSLLCARDSNRQAVPLLWLQNVRYMNVRWPIEFCAKPQYIRDSPESRALLVPNATYVVLRRFTAKEEQRRLTAAPLFGGDLPGKVIGLENHLNYIHRPHGQLGDDAAIGLAALLGSKLLDRYFRISNGNTQVNAAELRSLPLPPLTSLVNLGAAVRRKSFTSAEIEIAIAEVLRLPSALVRMIKADGQT